MTSGAPRCKIIPITLIAVSVLPILQAGMVAPILGALADSFHGWTNPALVAKVILVTAAGGKTVAETFKGLRPGGVSVVVGASPDPIEVSGMDLIFSSRKLEGALTGDPATGDETLRFSALSGISAMIETMPLEKAADAYAKMISGKARFRMVLTMA